MDGKSVAIGVAIGFFGLLLLMSLSKLLIPLLVIGGIILGAWFLFGGGRNDKPPA